jgi:hemerythrin
MALFTWYKHYSVNNDELDNHHQALFDIFNRLYGNCFSHDIPNCLEQIIEELLSYSHYHFIAEEQHMRDIGFNEIDQHIMEHRLFMKKILELQQVADNNEPEAIRELIEFLGKWLLRHVLDEDKKYAVLSNKEA